MATGTAPRDLPLPPDCEAGTAVEGEALETGLKLGYVTSRFPKLTETFVLYEILGLERAGAKVEFYPLLRERANVVHP
jgi:colanic acid/amylovoran biosynthesis glycosyltransferase